MSIIIADQNEFERTLLPQVFKHNKFQSFVRQLNMYGFHKIKRLSDNSLRAREQKNKVPLEYSNPYFQRDRPDLLWLIQIQKSKPPLQHSTSIKRPRLCSYEGGNDQDDASSVVDEVIPRDIPAVNSSAHGPHARLAIAPGKMEGPVPMEEQLSNIHRELQGIRQEQNLILLSLGKLHHDHDQLYTQGGSFQEQHNRHDNILSLLATVFNRRLNQPSTTVPSGAEQHGPNTHQFQKASNNTNAAADSLSLIQNRNRMNFNAPFLPPEYYHNYQGLQTLQNALHNNHSPIPTPDLNPQVQVVQPSEVLPPMSSPHSSTRSTPPPGTAVSDQQDSFMENSTLSGSPASTSPAPTTPVSPGMGTTRPSPSPGPMHHSSPIPDTILPPTALMNYVPSASNVSDMNEYLNIEGMETD